MSERVLVFCGSYRAGRMGIRLADQQRGQVHFPG